MYTETATQVPSPSPKPAAQNAVVVPYEAVATTPLMQGLYSGMPAQAYHADPCAAPSLSSTLARVLLNDSPAHAWARHPRLNPNYRECDSSRSMGTGSLVHALIADPEDRGTVEIGHFEDFRTKEARAWRDEVLAYGRLPVLERDFLLALPIAEAVRTHAAAGYTNNPFNPPEGARVYRELCAVWQGGFKGEGYYCRALIDCLALDGVHSLDLWDWKTAADVSDRAIERSVYNYNYAFQVAFYLRGVRKLLPSYSRKQVSATLVFVESSAPYTVRRVYLSEAYLAHAESECDQACALWERCLLTGDWSDPRNGESLEVELPAWAQDDAEIVIE